MLSHSMGSSRQIIRWQKDVGNSVQLLCFVKSTYICPFFDLDLLVKYVNMSFSIRICILEKTHASRKLLIGILCVCCRPLLLPQTSLPSLSDEKLVVIQVVIFNHLCG